mmetsp:Transcript_56201/g.90940  ORF Transcript_56201/g.90940 Transcript_56201/m.90940 type:complete len:214 (-) Transcript_56201:1151-1792(-)
MVTSGCFTSMIPLISRGTEAVILGGPVMLYSFHFPSSSSLRPVTLYSDIRTPSSKSFTMKSSSNEKESFFLPPRGVPTGYKVVRFFSHEPSRAVTWTAYSWAVMSEKKIFFTRKLLLKLAAMRAPPIAAASSPFRCCPSGSSELPSFLKYSESISCTFGTRQAPPTTSTWFTSFMVRLASFSAFSTGAVRRLKIPSLIFSNSARLMVDWKSWS